MQWMIALPKIQTYSVITCKINRPKTLFSRFKPAESQQTDPSIVASSVIQTVLPLTASNQNRSIRTIKLSCFAFSGRVSSLWPWPQRRESKGLVDCLNNLAPSEFEIFRVIFCCHCDGIVDNLKYTSCCTLKKLSPLIYPLTVHCLNLKSHKTRLQTTRFWIPKDFWLKTQNQFFLSEFLALSTCVLYAL